MSHIISPWKLAPVSLKGKTVELIPLSLEHTAELQKAVADGELWNLWYTFIPRPEDMETEIQRRLGLQQAGSMLPFTIIDRSRQQAVGMTTFMNIDAQNHRLEIGSTWYAASVQKTPINTEAKLLLLGYAFDTLQAIGVEFRTHFFNHQSRKAIERLGAKLDGVLRSHQRMPNQAGIRDTCVYSIIAHEWPTVQQHLQFRLEQNMRQKTTQK